MRITLSPERAEIAFDRARKRVSESSCGLCGVEQVLRPLPPVTARIATNRAAIARALSALKDHQLLGQATGAVHAAALCAPDGHIIRVREDVGRHNALDKLIGALAASGTDPSSGFILLSARMQLRVGRENGACWMSGACYHFRADDPGRRTGNRRWRHPGHTCARGFGVGRLRCPGEYRMTTFDVLLERDRYQPFRPHKVEASLVGTGTNNGKDRLSLAPRSCPQAPPASRLARATCRGRSPPAVAPACAP